MKYLPVLILCLLFSCAEDCSKCERELLICKSVQTIPVDLPEPSSTEISNTDEILLVGVTANDKYIFENDSKEYELSELTPILQHKMDSLQLNQIKISGDKAARYEAVFSLIALAKQNDWKPILAYGPE